MDIGYNVEDKLRALYDMYHSLTKRDNNVISIIDEEIEKIQKSEYKAIKEMAPKYVSFYVNRKIKLLKIAYKKGFLDEETVENEINELVNLKMNVVLELTADNISNLFRMN